jgi:predicted dehydrogenase
MVVALNGVTGRMGYNQHLVRSILAIRADGGVPLSDGSRVQPEPVLIGRSEAKLADIAARHDLKRWSTDLDTVLSDPAVEIYFDSLATSARMPAVLAAIDAGKHIYTEKPLAATLDEALLLARRAQEAGVRTGVVHDKLYLPGLLKLARLLRAGFFGRVLSVRGEFGYWVFEGDWQPAQRPSWNYQAEQGGGIVADMFCHWSYLLEGLFGRVRSVTAKAATHIDRRWDEQGVEYLATAQDAAYAIFELDGGVIAQVNSSWCTRVHREDALEFQVDGTEGSAVTGLTSCSVQHRSTTPLVVWNPDLPVTEPFRDQWAAVPDNGTFGNGFRTQWEEFIRNVAEGTPHPHDFRAGVRGVQLAEAGLRSSDEGRRVDIEEIA